MPGSFSHPFSDSSLWNIRIDSLNPTYTDAGAVQNVQFRDAGLANSWLQTDLHVYNTPSTAPTATWSFDTLNTTAVGGTFSSNGTIQLQTPTDLKFTDGGDGWAVFNSPDGVHSWEAWVGSYDPAANTYHAAYLVENDVVNGTGWGKSDTGAGVGIRAAGASLLGGIVTQDELNGLSIQHALSIELDSTQLAAATGPTSAGQFIFPAVTADNGSVGSYTGTIPMGAHFALAPDLDLTAAGLTPEGLALAKAYQTYGGYVVDTAGHTTALAQVEGTPQQQAHLFADIDWIRDHLVMTIDHDAGASSAAPQTGLTAQSGIAQTDTHQAAVATDVAGGTTPAPVLANVGISASPALIGPHGFDSVFYLHHNQDVQAAGVDAFQHYENFGWKEGRDPNALFDTNGYLAANPDVANAHINPLDHYDQYGWREGRDPSPAFDTTDYLSHYPDVAAAGIDPLMHYIQYGIQEGRQSFSHAIPGSTGNDIQNGTPNRDLFPGNGGQDTFVFAPSFGLKDFATSGRTAHDAVQFSKSIFDSFASDLCHASQFSPHVDISAGSDALWLKNTKLGALDSSVFHFG
jgi:hypothetical protein